MDIAEYQKRDVQRVFPVADNAQFVGNAPLYRDPDATQSAAVPQKCEGDPETSHCFMRDPSPRDQTDLDAARTFQYPRFYKSPYADGKCHLIQSPYQNMQGVVCGVDNANWVRGNQFGVNYDPAKIWGRKIIELEHNPYEPQQFKFRTSEPFYPLPDACLQEMPEFKTYPQSREYLPDGQPFYTTSRRPIELGDPLLRLGQGPLEPAPAPGPAERRPGASVLEGFSADSRAAEDLYELRMDAGVAAHWIERNLRYFLLALAVIGMILVVSRRDF